VPGAQQQNYKLGSRVKVRVTPYVTLTLTLRAHRTPHVMYDSTQASGVYRGGGFQLPVGSQLVRPLQHLRPRSKRE
jgi:hypothetical protein